MANVKRNENRNKVSYWDESVAATVLVYNGLLTDPYYPAYFEHNDTTMPTSDFIDELVIGKRDDISFLGRIGQLSNLIGGEKAFRMLDPYAFDNPMLAKHAQICADCSNVLLDLREGHGVFEATDWNTAEKKHIPAYVRDISPKVATRLHRDALCSVAVFFLSRVVPGSSLQRLGWMSVDDAAVIANAALCGYDKLDASQLQNDTDDDWLALGSKYAIRPKNAPEIERVSRQLENIYKAVDVWQSAMSTCRCNTLQEYVGVDSVRDMNSAQIASMMRNFAEESGVSAMMWSFYKGVPLEDVLA